MATMPTCASLPPREHLHSLYFIRDCRDPPTHSRCRLSTESSAQSPATGMSTDRSSASGSERRSPLQHQVPGQVAAPSGSPTASSCNLPGSPASLVGPLSPGVSTMMLSPFRRETAAAADEDTAATLEGTLSSSAQRLGVLDGSYSSRSGGLTELMATGISMASVAAEGQPRDASISVAGNNRELTSTPNMGGSTTTPALLTGSAIAPVPRQRE